MNTSPSSLLVRPAPINRDGAVEALSSWLFRLAVANGFVGYNDLVRNEHLPRLRGAMVDRVSVDSALISTLAHLSLLPNSRLHGHSLHAHISVLSHDPTASGRRWLLSSSGHFGRDAPARFAVCPACLNSDERAYWRISWRLSTTTTCATHRCLLVDACNQCGAPPAMSASRSAPLDRCETCGQKFGATVDAPILDRPPSWQTDPASTAACELPVTLSHPHLWWDGVRILLSILTRQRVVDRLAQAARTSCQRTPFKAATAYPRLGFDALPVAHRHRLLQQVCWLTSKWPHRFVDIVGAARLPWYELSASELEMPYWLWKVCKATFYRKHYKLSRQEIVAATALLERSGKTTSRIAVKRLLGARESTALDESLPPVRRFLTYAELIEIVERLNADVDAAPSGREVQASLLRDACCIAAAIWRQMSFREVCLLELEDGVALLREWREAALEQTPRGDLAKIFSKWMDLYLHGTRIRFQRYETPVMALFLSRYGRATNGFGLADRFSQLLQRCGVHDGQLGARLLKAPLDIAIGRMSTQNHSQE